MRDVSRLKAIQVKVKGKEAIIRTELEGNAYLAFKAAKAAIPK